MKKGISLITLIITIVIVVILAIAVVLTLTKNNPINSSKIANLVQLKTSMQDAINMYVSKDFTKNEGSRTLKNIIIDDYNTSLIDNTSESINTVKDGTNLTLYRIDKDKYYSTLNMQIGSTPTKDSRWYIDERGAVYLVYDFIKNVPSFMKEDNNIVSSVSQFTIVLDEAIQESFAESIGDIQIDGVIAINEKISVKFDTSKIEGYSYSKWTINNSTEKLGTDDETKYDRKLPIELNITSPGEYYIHILVVSSTGLKVEKISSVIRVEEKADLWDGTSATSFESGDGTKDNPYVIKTAKEISYLRDQVNAGNNFENVYIKLDSDIDLNNIEWVPIGKDSSHPFSGNFNGNGKKIYNLFINGSTSSCVGFFGVAKNSKYNFNQGYDLVIENLTIESGSIDTKSSRVGGIVGYAEVTTDNCGNLYIKDCVNKVNINNVNMSGDIGGIVGSVQAGSNANDTTPTVTIENCYNYGNISSTGNQGNYGGIIGINKYKSKIISCGNYGNINANVNSCGGIAGSVTSSQYSFIKNCFNCGEIINTSTSDVGGLVGCLSASVYNCYNTGKVSGNGSIGGIAGSFEASTKTSDDKPIINNSYNRGDIVWLGTGTAIKAGGIVGEASSTYCYNLRINSCYSIGNISAVKKDRIGAIIGTSVISISNSYYLDSSYSIAIGKDSSSKNPEVISKEIVDFKKQSSEEGAVVDLLNSNVTDADKVWKIDIYRNDGYPILEWQ